MRNEVNITAADAEMAMHMCDWTESEACNHLHKHGPWRHKSWAFLSVAVLVLSQPDPRVHFISLLTAILEEEEEEEEEKDDKVADEIEKFNYEK